MDALQLYLAFRIKPKFLKIIEFYHSHSIIKCNCLPTNTEYNANTAVLCIYTQTTFCIVILNLLNLASFSMLVVCVHVCVFMYAYVCSIYCTFLMNTCNVQVVLGDDASDCSIVLGAAHVGDVITISLASQIRMCYQEVTVNKCMPPRPRDHQKMIKRSDTFGPGSKSKHRTRTGFYSFLYRHHVKFLPDNSAEKIWHHLTTQSILSPHSVSP